MMKKLLILFAIAICSCAPEQTKVEEGQTWYCIYRDDDPFKPITIYLFEVLDVRDGYVLYVQKTAGDDFDTLSSSIKSFLPNMYLLNQKE